MKILDQLRPFFSFCQFFGFTPLFVEIDARTKKFKKLSFSLRHPITWWFIFVIFSQIAFFYLDMTMAWRSFYKEGAQQAKIPFLFIAFLLMEHVSFFVLALMTRYTIYKYPHVRKALAILSKVHNESVADDMPSKPSVSRRVILTIVVSVIMVSPG